MVFRLIKFSLVLQILILCLACQNSTLGVPLGSATSPSMPGCPTGPKTCIFVTWNASTSPNVGYHVWYGTSSGNYTVEKDAGTNLSYQFTGMAPGTYYIAATAYLLDGSSVDSNYSNEASAEIPVGPEMAVVIPKRQ
jgi:hypothetical protein